ncbi:MAG: hypothetical protein NT076_00960 [Candidatus Pacearchaeota archaeon]|nr:hypothetical protein [Candidatus Pacearchaeota archaeon]
MIEFFKAYDIRAHDKDLNEQTMDRVGQALVAYFQKNNYNSIVLGMDMRETSPMILEILKERALSGGLDITLIQGIGNKTCSTPLFNFTCSLNPEKAGIMITASHNPANYNGLKVNAPSVNAIGYLEGLNKVEELYEQNVQREVRSRGRLESAYPLDKYIQETCEQLALDRNGFRGVKIAYDCANSMSCVGKMEHFLAMIPIQ